jgi:hypothetical protein
MRAAGLGGGKRRPLNRLRCRTILPLIQLFHGE